MSLLSSFSAPTAYLIAKMLAFLALAALLGIFVGWAVGRLGQQKKARGIERDWRRTLADTNRFVKHED